MHTTFTCTHISSKLYAWIWYERNWNYPNPSEYPFTTLIMLIFSLVSQNVCMYYVTWNRKYGENLHLGASYSLLVRNLSWKTDHSSKPIFDLGVGLDFMEAGENLSFCQVYPYANSTLRFEVHLLKCMEIIYLIGLILFFISSLLKIKQVHHWIGVCF